jgi:FkbM family methyltransferase
MTVYMLGKWRAFVFYARALLESCGLIYSVHQVSGEEQKFAEFAISHSQSIIDCGPRLDTELVAIALRYRAEITLFEASPVFVRKLRKKIKAMVRSTDIVTVINMGVSSHSGSLRYYFLNQSFVENVPFRTYRFGRNIRVTSLDEFFGTRNKPDFIKSDVEGMDIQVFRGAKELLKSTKYFQLEMCSTEESSYGDLFKNFDLFLLHSENHPLWRGQGAPMLTPMETLGWETVFDSMR